MLSDIVPWQQKNWPAERKVGRLSRRPPLLVIPTPAFVEQCSPAKAHEATPQLNKTNGSAAQIVCFPGALGHTMTSKQALRNLAVAISFLPSIHCAQRKDQPTLLQSRHSKRRLSERPTLEGEPKSTCSPQAKLEIGVERKIKDDSISAHWRLLQPKAMLRTPERHDRMPSIRRAAKLAARQIVESELIAFGCNAVGRPHSQYGRQHLGCPKD
ncbi:hypothetical protein XI00_17465 [Bradyrhizobium sp. CCBAU 21359]|nr:hypothetical protein [Bradyrhizobium sp. CCBAU 21359]